MLTKSHTPYVPPSWSGKMMNMALWAHWKEVVQALWHDITKCKHFIRYVFAWTHSKRSCEKSEQILVLCALYSLSS